MKTKCWIAKGYKLPHGYIRIYEGKNLVYAHRLSYEKSTGKIPKGMCVCHKCDNPPCYRPSHLFLGTQAENLKDMQKKGRGALGDKNGSRKHPERLPRGINHVNSKLNPKKVKMIRKLWKSGLYRMKDIGLKFGVNPVTVFHVIHRNVWKHVK